MINFITNLPQGLRSGGFSAMNAAAYSALSDAWPTDYIGPINPRPSSAQWAISKARRSAGLAGDYFFFSQERLTRIARQARATCKVDAVVDFFHGFTPWVSLAPVRPYVAWGDCVFGDYIDIYHRREQFRIQDLRRIEEAEAAWLRGARRVAFTSVWAAHRATARYELDPLRVCCVGIFGEAEAPDFDAYAGRQGFAFVSTDFRAKGGHVVVKAFRGLQADFPEATLTIVGDAPPSQALGNGVTATGFLHKEMPDEARRFRDILGAARALVHPTRSDIAPLLIVEAAYFGCPVISSRRYAIPEMVEDGVSGRLVDDPGDVAAVRAAMIGMLETDDSYLAMRRAAWTRARAQFAKRDFEQRLVAVVREALLDAEAGSA